MPGERIHSLVRLIVLDFCSSSNGCSASKQASSSRSNCKRSRNRNFTCVCCVLARCSRHQVFSKENFEEGPSLSIITLHSVSASAGMLRSLALAPNLNILHHQKRPACCMCSVGKEWRCHRWSIGSTLILFKFDCSLAARPNLSPMTD